MAFALCMLASAGLGAWLLVTSPACAQSESIESRNVARRMAEEAAILYDAGEYERARDLFHRANLLFPAPTLELWEARTLDRLGRLMQAEERYVAVLHYQIRPEDSEVVRRAVADARVEIEDLRKRIPTIEMLLRGADPNDPSVEIQLDGRRLNPALIGFPVPVDAGPRTVRLLIKGREVMRVDVTLKQGDHKPMELDATISSPAPAPAVAPAARPAASPSNAVTATEVDAVRPKPVQPLPWYASPTAGWISAGVGAAGLGVGIWTGVIASRKHDRLGDHCPNNACPPGYADEIESFRNYRTASTVAYVVGGAGLVAGATILLVVPTYFRQTGTGLRLSPTSVAMVGSF